MPNTNKKYELAIIALLVLWVIYNLAVLLKTGFISDDAYNSQIKGQILQQGISLNDRILAETEGSLKGAGRFMVAVWYMTYGLYYFTQDPVLVKSINIAIILIGILLFYIFTKKETGSEDVALVAGLLIPCFFQFRLWHDPILAFTFLIPIIFALTMGALTLFQKYLVNGRTLYCFIATCLYLVGLLMYEIAFPLCLLFVAMAYSHSRKIVPAIKQSLPFTSLVAFLVAISAFFRLYLIQNSSYVQSTYPGGEFQLHLGKLITAFEIQTFSTVPLSYFLFNTEKLELILRRADYVVLTVFACGLSLLIYKIGRNTVQPRFSSWMACAAVLLFVPAGLTSLSGHQAELIQIGYGFGYIPVYLQYFGLCIFLVVTIATIATKIKWRIVLIAFSMTVGTVAAVAGGLNLGLNRAVALKANETYKYPRQLLEAALRAGITDNMKDGAFLFRTMRYPSDYTWLYTLVTGKKFETCELSDVTNYKDCIEKIRRRINNLNFSSSQAHGGVELIDLSKYDAWILSYNFERKSGKTGQVFLGKIDGIVQNIKSKTLIQVLASDIRVYDLQQNHIRKLAHVLPPINFLKLVEQQVVDMTETQPLDEAALSASEVDFEWLGNIYGREGTNSSNLRWSSGNAILTLHNMSDKPKLVDLNMELGTATSGVSELSIEYPNKKEMVTLGQIPNHYSKRLLLMPGQTEIAFTSNAKPIENGDPRKIVFGVFNFRINLPNFETAAK